jgi:hypothetical protein
MALSLVHGKCQHYYESGQSSREGGGLFSGSPPSRSTAELAAAVATLAGRADNVSE